MVPLLVLGHEFAGEIVAVGAGVSDDLIARRVAVDPVVSCGVCRACIDGQPGLELLDDTHSDKAKVVMTVKNHTAAESTDSLP